MSRRALFPIILAVAIGGLAPATAFAGTASVSGSLLEVSATAGQTNNLTITAVGPDLRLEETGGGATLTAGAGCATGGVNIVTCPLTSVTSMTVNAGDGNDQVVNGTTLPSMLLGEAGQDQLAGGSQADTINGGSSSDVLYGGIGGDTFVGGSEADYVSYSGRTAAITADIDGVADDGESGENDNVSTDVEVLIGGSAADTLTGGDLDNGLDGGPGADNLNGGLGNDYLLYWTRTPAVTISFDGVANDGEAGENDAIGPDVESAIGGNGADTITGDARANVLLGDDGKDTIVGAGGADALYGSNDIDLLDGGSEDDILDGGGQADVMFGRDGTDRVTYAGRNLPVTVDADNVADDGELLEGDQVHSDVENLTGGSAGDVLTGSDASNNLDGGAGADQVAGGAGDDELSGGAGVDVLDGGGDADTLDGGTDADLMNGGTGVDRATYASRTAAVTADLAGDSGDGGFGEGDTLGADIENLTGGSGKDNLTGNAEPNLLEGGPGDDTLAGAAGADDLVGGDGVDTLAGGADNDALTSGAGVDTLHGDEGDDTLDGGVDADVVNGGAGLDTLTGGSENDVLNGGPDADTLDGGIGADTLNGGDGTDELTYASRSAAVTVDLDGQADDGESGEGDNAGGDIENLFGGDGPDTLTGDGGANSIVSGAGNDTLEGGLGGDALDAGAGDDSVKTRDQTLDNVSCGTQTDQVVSDPDDVVRGDCEANDKGEPPATGPPGPDLPGDPPATNPPAPDPPADPPAANRPVERPADRVKTKISGAPVTLGADGTVRILVSCPAGRSSPCPGTIMLSLFAASKQQATGSRRSRRRAVAGRAKFSIPSGKTVPVKVKLSRNGRRRVLRERKVRCSINVALDLGGGKQVETKKTITIRAARRSRRR